MGWNPLCLSRTRGALLAVVMTAGMLLSGIRANAQATISNSLISVTLDLLGNITLKTTTGNPTDPNQTLLYGLEALSTTVLTQTANTRVYLRIDDGLANSAGNATAFDAYIGDTTLLAGQWLLPPTKSGNNIVAKYQTGPIYATTSTTTTTVVLRYTTQVNITISLIHDNARFQFDIVNIDTGGAHRVAAAFVQDISVIPAATATPPADGPIFVPNVGVLHNETEFFGTGSVPPYWESYSPISPATPTTPAINHTIRGTLRPLGITSTEPTPPSRFLYGRADRVNGTDPQRFTSLQYLYPPFDTAWLTTADPSIVLDKSIGQGPFNSAVGLYWDARQIVAGQTASIITFVGQGVTDGDYGTPLALSVGSLRALQYVTGAIQPTTFQISAFIQNTSDLLPSGGLALGPLSVFLELPKGLILDSDTPNKSIASVSPGSESAVTWNVKPDPANPVTGPVKFTVSASAGSGSAASKQISRQIEIPAIKQYSLLPATSGWQMFSAPFEFGTADPATILGLATGSFSLWAYDPTLPGYAKPSTLKNGQAYFIRLNTGFAQPTFPKAITGGTPIVTQSGSTGTTKSVTLSQGWNMIADPNVYSMRFADIQVLDTDTLSIISVTDAINQGWIYPVAFQYDPTIAGYAPAKDLTTLLMQPFAGYFIRVQKASLQLYFPGVTTPDASVTKAATVSDSLSARGTQNNWQLQLTASGTASADRCICIGVAPNATDGLDRYKYEKPPTFADSVSMDILRSDPTSRATRYSQDLRSSAMATKTWEFDVHGPANQTVTLTWPTLSTSVPRTYQLYLLDHATNTRTSLRSVSSYTVDTGASGSRKVAIIAEPTRSAGRVRITTFSVLPSPGSRAAGSPSSVVINYAISGDAQGQITIRDSRGRTLRTLSPTRAATDANEGSAVWDLRDQRGSTLSAGVYQIELVAISSDGQRSRQSQPYVLTR